MKRSPQDVAAAFIEYLKGSGEYDALPEIAAALQKEAYRNRDIHVLTATALGAADEKALRKALADKWGEHRVVLSVDPALLTGMVISFSGTVIDTSGQTKLTSLKRTLE